MKLTELEPRGKLVIEGIGEITITDRRSLEFAMDLLGYARNKLQVKFYCDNCHKKRLDEFWHIEFRKERYVSEKWQLPDKLTVLCSECYEKSKNPKIFVNATAEPILCPNCDSDLDHDGTSFECDNLACLKEYELVEVQDMTKPGKRGRDNAASRSQTNPRVLTGPSSPGIAR